MAERRDFAVTDLEVDTQNPRLEEGLTNEREAIRAMVRVPCSASGDALSSIRVG
jgi:hypothetical protein